MSSSSSLKPGNDAAGPDLQENCTSKLSPNRLPKKKREFPTLVMSEASTEAFDLERSSLCTALQKRK
jgi:hypothetical protein